MSQKLQKQIFKHKTVQEIQFITRYLDSMNNTLSMMNKYKQSVETFQKKANRENKKMLEALNFAAAQSVNSMGVEIQMLMQDRSKNSNDCLKLLQNQFIEWCNKNRSNPKVISERIEPLINFVMMAFKGEKLPKVATIKVRNEEDSGFNQKSMNRRTNDMRKSKERHNKMNEDVKNNKHKYEKKYNNQLNNKKTKENSKLISNYKTNKNTNNKSLLKDVGSIYGFGDDNNNNNIDEFINAPDLFGDDDDNNDKNINDFSDTKIDLMAISKNDYIDWKAPNGIYYNCLILDIDRYNNTMILKSNELKKKFRVEVNNKVKFAKSQSMSNRPGKVLFNHLYFSNKNRWTVGFINSFNNGYINIDTGLNQPSKINIHINDSRYVNFDFDKNKDKEGDFNMGF